MRAFLGPVLTFAFAGALVAVAASAGAADAGAPPSSKPQGDASISRIPPDPPPMSEKNQWVFDLRYDHGDIYLLGVHKLDLGAPQATPRAMGRFAIELYEGPTLIERVRYDFPMLLLGGTDGGADAASRGWGSFDQRLVSRIGVMFPATSRGTRLELWDRATDKRWPLPWPPTDTRPDGGAK